MQEVQIAASGNNRSLKHCKKSRSLGSNVAAMVDHANSWNHLSDDRGNDAYTLSLHHQRLEQGENIDLV
jgi:hypothetical protein